MLTRSATFALIGAVTALLAAPVAANAGSKGGGGSVTHQELTATKTVGSSSPKLFEALHNGTHIPKMVNGIKGGSTYDKHKDW